MRKLTSPEKFNGIDKKDEIIELIENEFDNDLTNDHDTYIHIGIFGEFTKEARDLVVEDYLKRGWSDVTHQTSSENGERGGLTGFKFYF